MAIGLGAAKSRAYRHMRGAHFTTKLMLGSARRSMSHGEQSARLSMDMTIKTNFTRRITRELETSAACLKLNIKCQM